MLLIAALVAVNGILLYSFIQEKNKSESVGSDKAYLDELYLTLEHEKTQLLEELACFDSLILFQFNENEELTNKLVKKQGELDSIMEDIKMGSNSHNWKVWKLRQHLKKAKQELEELANHSPQSSPQNGMAKHEDTTIKDQ